MRRSKPITSRPLGVGIRMRRTGAAAVIEEVVQPPIPPSPLIADALIITYFFDAAGGVDLDTRTRITAPFEMPDYVGWCRLNSFGAYIEWAGDNTGVGVESVWVDLAQIKADYPGQNISIECRAFWYGARANGNMTLSVAGITNGLKRQDNYTYYGLDGTIASATLVPANITDNIADCGEDGALIATITYDGESVIVTPS